MMKLTCRIVVRSGRRVVDVMEIDRDVDRPSDILRMAEKHARRRIEHEWPELASYTTEYGLSRRA